MNDSAFPIGISLAAPLEQVHTFTLRGARGLRTLEVGVTLTVAKPELFEAELTTVQLGAIAVDSLQASAFSAERSQRHISADGLDVVRFTTVRAGRGIVGQDGRRCPLRPGTSVLIRSVAPHHGSLAPHPAADNRSQLIYASLPTSLLSSSAPLIAALSATPLVKTPLLAAATNFLATMSWGLPEPGTPTANFVEHAIVDLVLAIVAERTALSLPAESTEAGTRLRIRDFVLRRLPDAELGPRRIAAEFGISIRYLHRLFESEDTSVGAFIRRERLKKAAAELADPTLRHVDVKTIAARSGFAGADQFARAFKSRYGMTPRDYRHAEMPIRATSRDSAPRPGAGR